MLELKNDHTIVNDDDEKGREKNGYESRLQSAERELTQATRTLDFDLIIGKMENLVDVIKYLADNAFNQIGSYCVLWAVRRYVVP